MSTHFPIQLYLKLTSLWTVHVLLRTTYPKVSEVRHEIPCTERGLGKWEMAG
jgi:hypothetical protein